MTFLLRLSLAATLALASGCSADLAEHDYRAHFPVGVSRHTAAATVARPAEGQGWSRSDAQSMDRLAQEHFRRGAGKVEVSVAARDEAGKDAAQAFGQAVAAQMALPAADVEVKVSVSASQTPDTALVEVPVWVADLPECGHYAWQPSPDFDNRTTANFGCAVQRNVGMMVQNPADLVRARDSSGRDGARAADVLDKYGRGVATGSAKEDTTGSTAASVGTGSK